MDVTVKDVLAAIRPAEDVTAEQAPNGAFDVILSSPTEDRDGERVLPDEWQQPLPDHITFDMDHGMSVASTVGSGRPEIQTDGTLRVRGTYASTRQAQDVRALVNEGHIRTTSVAFLRRTATDKKGVRKVTRELLNGAFVAVPANPDAVVLGSKALARGGGLVELAVPEPVAAALKAALAADPAALAQRIHDAAAGLGAACPDVSLGDGPGAGTGAKAASDTPPAQATPSDDELAVDAARLRAIRSLYS